PWRSSSCGLHERTLAGEPRGSQAAPDACTPWASVSKHGQELGSVEDRDTSVSAERAELLVAGHKILRPSQDGALEELVIVLRVGQDPQIFNRGSPSRAAE